MGSSRLYPVNGKWPFKLAEEEGEIIYLYGNKGYILPVFQSLNCKKIPIEFIKRKPFDDKYGGQLCSKCLKVSSYIYEIIQMYYDDETNKYADMSLGEFVDKMYTPPKEV